MDMDTNVAVQTGSCPTCGRRFAATKATVDKKLTQDLARAERAIRILQTYYPVSASQAEANALEAQRMRRALVNHGLLWSIYRRADKASGYQSATQVSPSVDSTLRGGGCGRP